ncbi:hypothetical protein LOZ53_004250 [Ophidiomyces ophidiicola]|nr:hypothetical protein LOZ55_000413 [Ophidiomyces ophidiicola]KAI1987648.1 hypothetical protein LOZ53_004250 [Ophidiomyces ophidiicola]KAI1991872.1 hypothetical protein LOZ51_004462 [Ophidiomyces ophidiicola]KAI1996483.1 hypothetical protein LOZ54_000121 [Ophidiomyces ophidiicola]
MDSAEVRYGVLECFCITAPHRRERFDWEGKVSNSLFYGEASSLVYMIAKPMIWEDDEDINARVSNSVQIASESTLNEREKAEKSISRRFAPILEVPHEIFGSVFEYLDIQSIFNLGLTCQELWPLSKYFIKKRLKRVLGIWAGTPLICPGCDHPKGESLYPPGLLSRSAEEELKKGLRVGEPSPLVKLLHIPGHEEIEQRYYKTNLFGLAVKRYKMVPLADISFESIIIAASYAPGTPHPRDMFKIAKPVPALLYPEEEKWILRNLTTREFVRAETIALRPEYIEGPFIRVIGFPELIISKTCWSEDPNTWINIPINKGPWAGHCFDVIPISKLKNIETWVDIGVQVAEELRGLCRAQYGHLWRERLVHRFERKTKDAWGRWRNETLWETAQRQASSSPQGSLDFFR